MTSLAIGLILALLTGPVRVEPAPFTNVPSCLQLYGQPAYVYCDPDGKIRTQLIRESFEPALGAQ